MKKTIEFHRVVDKMPIKASKHYTDELIVIDKNKDIYFAQYDFKNEKWDDLTNYDEWHGYAELKNIEMWAYLPVIDKNEDELLPDNFWFSDEHGHEVTVLGVIDKWCMVTDLHNDEPYVLPLEFVQSIYNESAEENAN